MHRTSTNFTSHVRSVCGRLMWCRTCCRYESACATGTNSMPVHHRHEIGARDGKGGNGLVYPAAARCLLPFILLILDICIRHGI